MGIQSLTKHIVPYAETVILGNSQSKDAPPSVKSVIIDGPSLVYHVYYRLLAWKDIRCDAIDPQPTCDQVSRGVATCLVDLANRGVEICRIYFDGALPVSKRETRLGRIEKSRQKLEVSRRQPLLKSNDEHQQPTGMKPDGFWQTRHLPSRWKRLPENPFMVSGVFEDLKFRWSKQQITTDIQTDAVGLNEDDYPWAAITMMVPGEADLDCAREAKRTGAVVLTNDSDLVVHDLGPQGAVVLLNSLYLLDNVSNHDSAEIRGLRLCPRRLCDRLGIQDLQRFAYELSQDSHLGLLDLVRRAKKELKTEAQLAGLNQFLQEYRPSEQHEMLLRHHSSDLTLDPRVSELFWQYEWPGIYCWGEYAPPHIYLGLLPEDPSRRCAWEQGRIYRALGYSLLNLSYPASSQYTAVHEFVRRGGRIVSEMVTLSGGKTIISDLDLLRNRLALARTVFQTRTELSFWVMFALSEIYRDPSNSTLFPTAAGLAHFLGHGCVENQASWTDIHLMAQIHAVLYSLRVLKQLLGTANEDLRKQHQSLLSGLPPLHVLLGSRHDMTQGFLNSDVSRHLVFQLIQTYG